MSLIKCPCCGVEISDKAEKCIHCGTTLIHKVCPECGVEITSEATVCPSCGCPIQEQPSDYPKKKSKKGLFAAIGIAIAAVVAIFIVLTTSTTSKAEYEKQYEECAKLMMTGAVDAESQCSLIHTVWYDTIFDKYHAESSEYKKGAMGDFNKALQNLFNDEDYISKTSELKENQKQVAEIMKKIKKHPSSCDDSYEALSNLYDTYTTLITLATNPTGSLESYTSSFREADGNAVNDITNVSLYLDNN